jgi:hypothetical protein
MESGCAAVVLEKQALDLGVPAILASPRPATRCVVGRGSGTEADIAIIFDAFANAVGRLEGLLDKETTMLIEHRTIALDDFNHKKRHGLLELSRAMDAMRGVDRDCLTYDPKAALAGLRVKLERNLAILQTHLDAGGAIAAIISRTIQEHDSDGTYTPEVFRNGRAR